MGLEKTTRFYQASTSELYGMVQDNPNGTGTDHMLGECGFWSGVGDGGGRQEVLDGFGMYFSFWAISTLPILP